MTEEELTRLREYVDSSSLTLFFGGAGVSTESGIPDFRGSRGLYGENYEGLSPERILSAGFFRAHPTEFFKYIKAKILYPDAEPNRAHKALAQLERMGKLQCVITQNIDGLHEAAGSKNVIDLHGDVHRNYCVKCGRSYPLEYIIDSEGVPRCECGGIIRPDVVLYDEQLDDGKLQRAFELAEKADLLIVGGTSLNVYPAAGVVDYFNGRLVIINLSPTPYDTEAQLCVNEPIGQVLTELTESYPK